MIHLFTNKRGFTLIEILIVIAIIGILASIALVGLAPAQQKAHDARRISDLRQIQTALELYYTKQGVYPTGNFTNMKSQIQTVLSISNIPQDPINSGSFIYNYAADSGGTTYALWATLEDGSNPVFKSVFTIPPGLVGGPSSCTTPVYCVSL